MPFQIGNRQLYQKEFIPANFEMKQLIKNSLRPYYAYLRYLFNRYVIQRQFTSFSMGNQEIDLFPCSDADISYFGYYTTSPENEKRQVIFNVLDEAANRVEIHLKDKDKDEIIGSTHAFNMQQGCMLQWGYSNQNLVYYNRFNQHTKEYESVIYNVNSKKEQSTFPKPIYALSKQEDYALSLNFDRLAIMRPDYGYFCKRDVFLPDDENDGIWKIDLKNRETKLIVTLERLKNLRPTETMKNARHKVNHIDISPDGKRFMFLHRWVGPKGRFMRLITADRNGENIYILNGDKMTSHSWWMNNEVIVSFCYTEQYSNAYVLFTDLTDKVKKVSDKLPVVDGHPSTTKDGQWMITDTYPDTARMSRLYLYNIHRDKLVCLGRFYQPLKYTGTNRIDLHPKWNMNEDTIYFESGHSGKRKLYALSLKTL